MLLIVNVEPVAVLEVVEEDLPFAAEAGRNIEP